MASTLHDGDAPGEVMMKNRKKKLRVVADPSVVNGEDDRLKLEKSAPPGWGGTVEHMKQHKDISNPFALAWSMKKKGMKPHYAETRKSGITGCSTCLKAAFDFGMMKGGHVLVAGLYYQDASGHVFYLPPPIKKTKKE